MYGRNLYRYCRATLSIDRKEGVAQPIVKSVNWFRAVEGSIRLRGSRCSENPVDHSTGGGSGRYWYDIAVREAL